MSNNFYVHPAGGGERIHLGKSTNGGFTFHAPPGVTSYDGWLTLLDRGEIRDEYNAVISRQEMVDRAAGYRPRPWVEGGSRRRDEFVDPAGRKFVTAEFC